jgi:hypothetical protein
MFRWYYDATQCYVYLLDVPSPPPCTTEFNPQSWDSDFWRSRWFTRGWTLQELLAPRSVEFFSRECVRLGDKFSLSKQISEITGVNISAIQGAPLSQFSVDERFLRMERRQTTLEVDRVYALAGILDIKIPLFKAIEGAIAFERLREMIDKREKCMHDLRSSDPRDDKKRIEDIKGGLLNDSYCWILQTPEFIQWRSTRQNPLLWIKGDPGKGKTMLLCGIINELDKLINNTAVLSYFFYQATDIRINSATAALRDLLYMLISQRPSLASYLKKKYDHAGKALFEDANSWVALSGIFTNMLQDPSLHSTYLIVDALDECTTGLPELLKLIIQTSSSPSRVKWVVSSRNWPSIERDLDAVAERIKLSLELNEQSVSSAVTTYIQTKIGQLAKENNYNNNTQEAVQNYLVLNAYGTFLWVALVCQELKGISG